jgi:hypothetical protein
LVNRYLSSNPSAIQSAGNTFQGIIILYKKEKTRRRRE